jgi:hypothetical protein
VIAVADLRPGDHVRAVPSSPPMTVIRRRSPLGSHQLVVLVAGAVHVPPAYHADAVLYRASVPVPAKRRRTNR